MDILSILAICGAVLLPQIMWLLIIWVGLRLEASPWKQKLIVIAVYFSWAVLLILLVTGGELRWAILPTILKWFFGSCIGGLFLHVAYLMAMGGAREDDEYDNPYVDEYVRLAVAVWCGIISVIWWLKQPIDVDVRILWRRYCLWNSEQGRNLLYY